MKPEKRIRLSLLCPKFGDKSFPNVLNPYLKRVQKNPPMSTKPFETVLASSEKKPLLSMRGRPISFLCFDDQLGIVKKYNVLDSNFIEYLERHLESWVHSLQIFLEVKEMTLSNETQILCKTNWYFGGRGVESYYRGKTLKTRLPMSCTMLWKA